MIAQRLKECLPDFSYTKISKKSGEWETWLIKICKENDWHHTKTPIIWREISMTKGKKYYIGEISKFLDLCQDYYGLKREMLTGEILEKSEMEWFTRRNENEYIEKVKLKAKEHVAYRCRQVCILGAGCQACDVLVMELLHMPMQNRENGLEIRLFDESRRERKLEAIANDAKHCLGYSGLGSCRVAKNIKEALYNVDLVIVLDSFPRRANESLVKWLKRNRNAMCILGNALNKYARKHCRVIIGSPSNQPICYNATVLASFATKLHVRNIVVVTQDLGRETLNHLAKKAKVELKDLYCPPVWGFIGLNRFIDVRRTLQNYFYKVPGPRISVNLSQGTEELELRTIESLIKDEDIDNIFMSVVSHKVETTPRLGRVAQLAKITAILDLLRVWTLRQEDRSEILSLGVYSDGTFNIPEGLYWSQPVTMEKGFWKPFAKYPIPRKIDINIHSFFVLGLASLKQTNVIVRKHRDKKLIPKQKKPKKFDLGLLRKLPIPPVRTQSECLSLLKQLAKEILDLDFEANEPSNAVEEESDVTIIETLSFEKIYCECWRQELMQLRKIASEKSSTTEVEVDLSENLSGSEWSVINPSEPFIPSKVSLFTKSNSGSVKTASESMICDCGEDCHCLDTVLSDKNGMESTSKTTSAGQSYQSKDSLEEGTKVDEDYKKKEIRFDSTCDDREKTSLKFYGTKDSIVDEVKRSKMLKSIQRYEREWKNGEIEGVESSENSAETDEIDFLSQKFHVSLEGGYEIIGDPEGLEALEQVRKSSVKESVEDFTDMWTDVVTPALQVLSIDSDSRSTSLEISDDQDSVSRRSDSVVEEEIIQGEDYHEKVRHHVWPERTKLYKSNLDVIPEVESEDEGERLVEVVEIEMHERTDTLKTDFGTKTKREGIPKCCLCHCIVPEGELGCHCGETRVMEVFKKESFEAIQEIQEEYSIVIERKESNVLEETPELDVLDMPEYENDMKLKKKPEIQEEGEIEHEEPEKLKRDIFSLPPESFFPFSPKPSNRFSESERPREMCKSQSSEGILPSECFEMLREIKERTIEEIQLKEKKEAEKEESEVRATDNLAVEDELDFELQENRAVFEKSISSVFHPIQDWKKTLMKKYREWFDGSKDVRDEFYYDIAVEEVSSDEYEYDKELDFDDLHGAEFHRSIEKSLQNRRGLYSLRMDSTSFGYSDDDGPEKWGSSYPNCLSPYQSPVNIETDELEYREIKRPLKWSNLNKIPASLILEKNEISLGMTAVWKTKWDIPYISGGPLTEKYYFYHFHFHWNTSSNAGSEHSVNHKRFPLEIHVVYTTKQDGAPTENDKILVTGFMVTLTGIDNPGFSSLINSARKLIGEKEKQISLPPFPFKVLGLDFCEDYVIYSGSLTTPPCSSGITWIISSRPIYLSIRQYNILKQVVSIPGQIYSTNSRPVQELNGRKIFYVVTPGCPKREFKRVIFNEDMGFK